MNHEIEKVAEARDWYNKTLADKVIKSLERNHMTGIYVETKEEALRQAISLIPEGSKVGFGTSLTLNQIGVKDLLRKGNYNLIDRDTPGLSADEEQQMRRDSLVADVFLTSTNAITLDGKLVNIDGTGNRVAAISYGPKKVIVVTGINKIVPDMEAALQRLKDYITPLHGRRFNVSVPCAQVGSCIDCHTAQRMCNSLGIIENQRQKNRIIVILIGEELGL